jgi:hypothetical protein
LPQYPNPEKPERKFTVKTKNKTNTIEFGTQELTKVKHKFTDFLNSRFLIFLSIFARKLVLRDYSKAMKI